jgi:hypothetical protein
MIPRLNSSLFDWLTWRNGSPLDVFQIPCRTDALVRHRLLLCQHAVGWCPGEYLPCRPKEGQIAVMFFKDNRYFWFHLRAGEAAAVFGINVNLNNRAQDHRHSRYRTSLGVASIETYQPDQESNSPNAHNGICSRRCT